MNEQIDVIIPAYNAHATITRCLSSIATQTIVGDVIVTIVDDCSDTPYDDVKALYPQMKIDILRLDENKGPGYARNYGLQHTESPLVTFIDADDTFNGAFALQTLRTQLLSDPKSHSVFGTFLEERPDGFAPHTGDTIWVFGKMYRRAFLKKYDIYMNETRSNEDTGFNTLIKLCSNEEEQIKFIQDVVYVWHATAESITRANDCDYSFNASFDGYTDNMIWAITEARKRFPFRENINYFIVEVMCNLYYYYVETLSRKPEYGEKNWRASKRYYDAIYKTIEPMVNDKILSANYYVASRNFYLSPRAEAVVPTLTIQEFIERLKDEISEVQES